MNKGWQRLAAVSGALVAYGVNGVVAGGGAGWLIAIVMTMLEIMLLAAAVTAAYWIWEGFQE